MNFFKRRVLRLIKMFRRFCDNRKRIIYSEISDVSLSTARYHIRIYQFFFDWLLPFLRKIAILQGLLVITSKMLNTEYRSVIKFFTWKGLSATEITKELDNVDGDSIPSYRTAAAKWVAQFKDPTRSFENVPRSARPTTKVIYESTRVVEELVIDEFLFDV